MTLITSDYQRSIDIGDNEIWHSLYSTIHANIISHSEEITLAIQFLESRFCSKEYAIETARQFNLIRDMLSQFTPACICYDYTDLSKDAPWIHDISPVFTSCANFFTTADGGDLLYEIVSILCYAGIVGVSVFVQ